MEDKYYYKVRSVEADLDYLVRSLQEEGDHLKFMPSESKRRETRRLLSSIIANANKLQAKMGDELSPEFPNVEVL